MLKKVALTGPESTGKSQLAESLSIHYQTLWVPEYARTYLQERPDYQESDLLIMAKQQLVSEQEIVKKSNTVVFLDTEFIVFKVWSDYMYKHCHPWIENAINEHTYDLYLLCAPDVAWRNDPLRSNPNDRQELFEKYQTILDDKGLNYRIITGLGNQRLLNAVSFVDELLA